MSKIKVMSTDGVVEKRKYSTPTIKSVEFKVERGFAATESTDLYVGDRVEETAGTETYGSDSWTTYTHSYRRPTQPSQE